MKFLLLLALAISASVEVFGDYSPFSIDKEYKYQYKSTGENAYQYGLNGKLTIQNQGGQYVYFRFKPDVEHSGFGGFIHQQAKENGAFAQQAQYNKQQVIDYLSKPIRVTYYKGVVRSYDGYPDDATWSLNIKKAIVSLFQLNFDRVNEVRFQKSNYLKPQNGNNFYRVMEDSIGGECETVYEIYKDDYYYNQNFDYSQTFNVSKHRLYDRCSNRPYFLHSSFKGYKYESEQQKSNPLKTFNSIRYEIYGTKTQYTINHINSLNTYTFTPFTTNGKYFETKVSQYAEFIGQSEIREPITFPSNYVPYKSLAYNYTYTFDESHTQPQYHERNYEYNYQNPIAKIGEYLNYFAGEYDYTTYGTTKETGRNVPAYFNKLQCVFATLTYDQINQAYNQYANFDYKTATQKQKYIQGFFYDILAVTGTNPSIKYIIYLIESGKVQGEQAAQILQELPKHWKEQNQPLLDTFYTFVKGPEVRANKQVYSAAYLTFGTMVNYVCSRQSYYQSRPGYFYNYNATNDQCYEYAKDIYKLFTVTTDEYEQLILAKVLANIGTVDTFPYTRTIVENREGKYPLRVRFAAIMGVFKFIDEVREQVYSTFLPIYNNRTEDSEMRNYAFIFLIASEPSYDLLYEIGYNLDKEEDEHVGGFVHAIYRTYYNYSDPSYARLSKDIKKVWDVLNMENYKCACSESESNVYITSYFNKQFQFGGAEYYTKFGSKYSSLPNSIYYGHKSQFLGYSFDVFEFFYRSRGLKPIVEKVFGPDGYYNPYNPNKSVLSAFSRKPRDTDSNRKELDEIEKLLKFKSRSIDTPFAEFSFRAFNQEFRFFNLEENDFRSFIEHGYFYLNKDLPKFFQSGQKVNYRKFRYVADVEYEVPTDIGFPLQYKLKIPYYASIEGEYKFEFQPGFFGDERQYQKPTNFKLNANLQAIIDTQAYATVALYTPTGQKYGYGLKHEIRVKVPINGQIDYDLKEKKLAVNFKASQSAYEPFHYNVTPYYFAGAKDGYKTAEESYGYYPAYNRSSLYNNTYNFGKSFFGNNYKIEHNYAYKHNSFGYYYEFFRYFLGKYTNYNGYQPKFEYNTIYEKFATLFRHAKDYFFYQPNGRPYHLSFNYEPNPSDQTKEYEFTFDYEYNKPTEPNKYQPQDTDAPKSKPYNKLAEKYIGFKTEFKVKGGATPRTYSAQFKTKYVHAPYSKTYRMLENTFDYHRSPIPGYDANEFKFCFNANRKYPKFQAKWYDIDYQQEQKIDYDATVKYGTSSCEDDKQIHVKGVFYKSEEQKQREKNNYYYGKQINRTFNFTQVGDYFAFYSSYFKYYQYKFDIEYKNLPEYTYYYWNQFGNLIKYYYAPHAQSYSYGINNPANKIKIEGYYNYSEPLTTFKVYTPTENVFFSDIRLNPSQTIKSKYITAQEQYVSAYMAKNKKYQQCYIEKNNVYTFDNVQYNFPKSDCWFVAAKDFSPYQQKQYTVLVKNYPETNSKAIKIYFDNRKIEIVPNDASGAQYTVRVDGIPQTVSVGQKYYYYGEKCPITGKYYTIFMLYKQTPTDYYIYSPKFGIGVWFYQYNLVIKSSTYNKGVSSGICGEYDGIRFNEFTGPSGCRYQNATNFAGSYAVADGSCAAPQYNSECEYYSYENRTGDDECVVKRNRIVYRADGKSKLSRKVCFSTQPVAECREGCVSFHTVKVRHGFHCLNARDKYVVFLRDAARTRSLPEVTNLSEDYYVDIEYPTDCVRY